MTSGSFSWPREETLHCLGTTNNPPDWKGHISVLCICSQTFILFHFRIFQGTLWSNSLCEVFSWWGAVCQRQWRRNSTFVADDCWQNVRPVEMYLSRGQSLQLRFQHSHEGGSITLALPSAQTSCFMYSATGFSALCTSTELNMSATHCWCPVK